LPWWTAAKVIAAKAMADELEGLNDAERLLVKASIDDIAADTPMSEVAAVRIKKLMPKVLTTGGEVLRKLIVDVASEQPRKCSRATEIHVHVAMAASAPSAAVV